MKAFTSSPAARWNKKSHKLDNRGAAIAMTIVAIAVISVLAALALWIAYMNYFMKVTDMNATNNFYSAEGVVEQIRTGLQNELSDASGDAYRYVLEHYTQWSSDERKSQFVSRVTAALRTSIRRDDSENKYSVVKLCKYVYTGDPSYASEHATIMADALSNPDQNSVTVHTAPSETAVVTSPGDNFLIEIDYTKDTLTLRDVNVEYTDGNGYVSVVNTDFRLQIPSVDFGDTDTTARKIDYVVVADEHLTNSTSGTKTFLGNVYGGNGDNSSNPGFDSTTADVDNGMIIQNGATYHFKNATKVISGKSIKLGSAAGAGADTLKMDDSANYGIELWADNILLGSSGSGSTDNGKTVDLQGSTYVANDLSIDGKDCKVTLAGSYMGFGLDMDGSTSGKSSSAILINGKNTTLDFSGLSTLVLGGRSYVGTREVGATAISKAPALSAFFTQNDDIGMSDSIAFKGNQVAFLVPGEAIMDSAGNLLNRNPLTPADYMRTNEYKGIAAPTVDMSYSIPGTDIPISNFTTEYKTVFAQGLGSTNGGSDYLVYYYLVLPNSTVASEYFKAYYGSAQNKAKLDTYLLTYLKQDIKMKDEADFARLSLRGNWMALADDADHTVTLHDPTVKAGEDTESVLLSDIATWKGKFANLNTTLTESSTGTGRVYDNWIEKASIEALASGSHDFQNEAGDTVGVITGGDYTGDAKVVVAKGDVTLGASTNTRVIISNGDVTVNGDFKGVIFSAGTVTLGGGNIELENDPASTTQTEIVELLQAKTTIGSDEKHVYDYLKGGNKYSTGGSPVTPDEDAITNLNELVNYENWSKR